MATTKKEDKYTKEELINSKRWNRYTLLARLADNKKYSIKEVNEIVKKGR